MPNWVDQEFAITGPQRTSTASVRWRFTGTSGVTTRWNDEPTFPLLKGCPRGQGHATGGRCAGMSMVDGVLFPVRSDPVKAHFSIQRSWDFAAAISTLAALLRDWPETVFLWVAMQRGHETTSAGSWPGIDGIAVDAVVGLCRSV